MFVITAAQLHAAAPQCPKPDAWAAALNDAMLLYGIAADRDYVVNFLAQAAHESEQFNRLEESLNYTAERLVQVWPRRFPSLTVAVPYARNAHALADFVYANRMGNGSEESGDGWNYRGRGVLMVTGKANYQRVAQLINDPLLVTCPDRLCTMRTAATAAAAWWSADPRLNLLADDTATDDDAADFVSITRIVNGGTVGLAARSKLRDAFASAIPA
jgi:putative chitinase